MKRKLKLLSLELEKLLLKQATHEMENYLLYRNFANYYDLAGIANLAKYYYKRAEEELNHHNWIIKYLSDADCRLIYPPMNMEELQQINSPVTPFTITVSREIETTELIYNIYEAALAEKDYMTTSWLLEKLIKEQIEEENTSRMALAIFESATDVYIVAEEIYKLLK